jgi:putative two-component system response regulator
MKHNVLIVDDCPEERFVLSHILGRNTDLSVLTAGSGSEALEVCKREPPLLPELILLDIIMPPPDGFDVAEELRRNTATRDIPIIFITALRDKDSKDRISKISTADYVSKPFKEQEILARVNTQLELKKMFSDLKMKNFILENVQSYLMNMVSEKTQQIKGVTLALVNALENASLLNDSETGNHVQRVSEFSVVLARGSGYAGDFTDRIKLYASLHDIGKMGLPDAILKKSGRYTGEEFDRMKQHVIFGSKMLDHDNIDVMAKNIVLYHHEKWDGSGYVKGLKGTDIPMEARIVALADVYDALRSRKTYRSAYSVKKTCAFIKENAGKHFDPDLVDVFRENHEKIIEIDARIGR